MFKEFDKPIQILLEMIIKNESKMNKLLDFITDERNIFSFNPTINALKNMDSEIGRYYYNEWKDY